MSQNMIEIEIINACLSFGGSKDPTKMLNGIDSYCVVKMFGKEIARTEVAMGTFDPIWHEKFPKALHELVSKEVLYNRPFYLECIDIEVYDCSKSVGDKHIKIFETRVPIASIGLFKSYRLLKCSGSEGKESHDENRIFVRIGRVSNVVYDKVEHFRFQQLSSVCPIHCPLYRHLYMDFSWSPNAFTYNSGLPGPTKGELIMDRYYSVEWRVASGTNVFGDKLAVSCTGELLVTDLRVIFVPYEIHSPALTWGAETVSLKDPTHFVHTEGQLTPSEILAIQRYTFQLPLSAIQECKIYQLAGSGSSAGGGSNSNNNASSGLSGMPTLPNALGGFPGMVQESPGPVPTAAAWVLCLEGADGSSTEFIVKKHHGHRSHRKLALEFDRIHLSRIKDSQCKLDSALYRSGLASDDIEPQVWCERVLDYIQWELKLDMVWIRWAKYLKRSCKHFTSQGAKAWLKKALSPIDLDVDFQRLRVQDMDWRLSDLNGSYGLCPTYPSVLVFPGALQDEDIQGAAADRSIGRLPALVWLHPDTKAPLCRAAQPLSGMSGNTIEQDKRMCVAIKQSCPTGLPLRIADARPKLNANANAMQGKGFENISFLGGPSVASIVFMDIDNIHVIRHSLAKLRESLNTGSNAAADPSGAGAGSSANNADGSTVHASKWTSHISSILRGAAGVADSLMLGHPVLVHCSDGWDRTSQLTALAQLMIDPHYRTTEGFLALLQKEWASFGHKFEDRLGRRGHSKEVSPVCLQFLDCVWQMLRQFPTAFEFTSAFITLLSQAMYSGLFVTFRRNSERDRLHMMRTVGPYEDMQTDDFDYSTLSGYINLLLRTSNVAAMLLNAHYLPPKPSQKQVHYLRPSFGLHDLDLWKDGLCGMNNNVHASSAMSAPTVTADEAAAMQRDLASRYAGYLELHMDHLPRHVQGQLELILASRYPTHSAACPDAPSLSSCLATTGSVAAATPGAVAAGSASSGLGSAEIRLQRAIYHHSAVLNPASNKSRRLRSCWRKEEYDPSFFDTLDAYRAAEATVRLQTWVRAVLVARTALKILEGYIEEKGLQPPPTPAGEAEAVDVDGWVVKRRAHLRKSLYSARPKSYFRVFYILAASQVRTARRDREQRQEACADFMRSIIDDALEQAMVYCIRNDNYQLAYAYRRSAIVDVSELGFNPAANARGSSDYSKSSADKKSFSSRIFSGLVGVGGSSKGDASPGNSTNTASASAAALAGEGSGGSASPLRQSGRYEPPVQQGRSYSPKPTLMGRLLGK